jgi:hypothetical protein
MRLAPPFACTVPLGPVAVRRAFPAPRHVLLPKRQYSQRYVRYATDVPQSPSSYLYFWLARAGRELLAQRVPIRHPRPTWLPERNNLKRTSEVVSRMNQQESSVRIQQHKTKTTIRLTSKSNNPGFLTMALAIAIRCFCPPLSCTPRSPTAVS